MQLFNSERAKISFSYLGNFSDGITDKLIGISEFYIEHRSELGKLKNKVSFLIAECFQNVVRHGGSKENKTFSAENHKDFFNLLILEDRAVMSSCNLIESTAADKLASNLEKINSLDQEGLKKLYKDVLSNSEFTERGGAGLGLIDMARKSGLPLKYSFRDKGNGIKQFYMGLEIIDPRSAAAGIVSIEEIIQWHHTLTVKDSLMHYKGDLSTDIIVPIVEMVQGSLSTEEEQTKGKAKRIIISLIETLQNIAKHGLVKNGIREGEFMLCQKESNFSIEVCNYIESAKKTEFEKVLVEIDGMNMDGIQKLYKERLLAPEITEDGNCGLGLLEIARYCNKNMTYAFQETAPHFYYTLNVNI